MMAAKVFISYRRTDSAGYSGRVMDRLDRELGRDLVFMDVDAIPLGTNFSKVLALGVIGPSRSVIKTCEDSPCSRCRMRLLRRGKHHRL
jgi:hypothetical protein